MNSKGLNGVDPVVYLASLIDVSAKKCFICERIYFKNRIGNIFSYDPVPQ